MEKMFPPKKLSEDQSPAIPGTRILWDLINEAAIQHSLQTALVCLHQPSTFLSSITKSSPSPYLRWNYTELSLASHAFASALAASGIKPGMRVVTFVTNGAEFYVCFRASLELNCTFAPLNPKTVVNVEETRHVLGTLQPSVILTVDVDVAERLEVCAPEIMQKVLVKLVSTLQDSSVPDGWKEFGAFCEERREIDALTHLDIVRKEDDVVVVYFTSGTTSLSKGCPHTSQSHSNMLRAWREVVTGSVCLHLPTFHAFGSAYSSAIQISGLKIVLPSATFNFTATLKAIEVEKCAELPGVPAMITALLAHPDIKSTDTSSLRWVQLASTTILPDHLRMCIEGLGSLKASELFGMSEICLGLIHKYEDIPTKTIPEKITVGRVIPGGRVCICNPESKEIVQRGEKGELHIGGSTMISKYWLGPSVQGKDANDACYTDEEGIWFTTGDQAVMYGNGEVKIVGRYKDLIIRGGVNISPGSIEADLASRYGLTAEVVGVPDEIAGEVPVAIVKSMPGKEVELQKLKAALVLELGVAFAPEEIIELGSLGLDEFPINVNGKVQKYQLKSLVAERRRYE